MSIAYSPDGSLLHTLDAGKDRIEDLAFALDGARLISGSADGIVYVMGLTQ